MVGLSKEQLLVCMGLPASKAAEGQTEFSSYNSGDGTTIASGSVSQGSFSGVSSRRFCQINVVMSAGAARAYWKSLVEARLAGDNQGKLPCSPNTTLAPPSSQNADSPFCCFYHFVPPLVSWG